MADSILADSILAPETIDSFFSLAGPLAQLMGPAYETRPTQVEMAQRIALQLRKGGVLLVEAGTGTGKSLAYLLPIVLQARAQHQPAIVATYTIHLQEQLVHHDLPILEQALARWERVAGLRWKERPIRYVLAKGWSNYLCRLRLKLERGQPDWSQKIFPWASQEMLPLAELGAAPDDPDAVAHHASGRDNEAQPPLPEALLEWAAQTRDGSRSDLPHDVSESIWARVAAASEWCLRAHCPYFEDCFFFSARRKLEGAELVVTNQHLLLLDAALRAQGEQDGHEPSILPEAGTIVIDEAHHLEDVASHCLGHRVGRGDLLGLVRATPAGLRRELAGSVRALFTEIDRFVQGQAEGPRQVHSDGSLGLPRRVMRIGPDQRGDSAWKRVVQGAKGVEELLNRLAETWRDQAKQARGAASASPGAAEANLNSAAAAASALVTLMQAQAWEAWANQAAEMGAQLSEVVAADDADQVFWLEAGTTIQLRSAPLEVGPLLRRLLFATEVPIVLTSATLSAGTQGQYFARRWGVPGADWLALSSLFCWKEQACLAVPTDLVAPDRAKGEVLAQQTAACLTPLLRRLGGRTLVLFTSYTHLQATRRHLANQPQLAGFTWLVQGERARSQLVGEFRQRAGQQAALLATDSLWEGLDLVGPMLSCVVIARLPFPVPDEPLVAARAEQIQQQGGSPFNEWYLPQAVTRFRQGAGRLLRATTDRGAIVVLDPRLVQKSYGRLFWRSIGIAPQTGRWEELVDGVVDFIQNGTK